MWSRRELGDTLIRVSSCPAAGTAGGPVRTQATFAFSRKSSRSSSSVVTFCHSAQPTPASSSVLSRLEKRLIAMASEIGVLSRRLLTSCSLRNTSLRSSQLASQPLWLQPRTFSTSRTLFNNESLFGVKGPLAEKPQSSTTSSSTSSSPTAAAKKKPHTPFAYDAASSNFDISQLIAMDSDDFMMKHHAAGQQEMELRTRPQTGRTIHVTGSRDFSAAIKALEVSTKRNRIKSLWHGQKFHERPGMRRKRLRRERSVKRYKEGFVATVRRVQELTNQGW